MSVTLLYKENNSTCLHIASLSFKSIYIFIRFSLKKSHVNKPRKNISQNKRTIIILNNDILIIDRILENLEPRNFRRYTFDIDLHTTKKPSEFGIKFYSNLCVAHM